MFRLSAIGDVCHTLPILRTLQATWPTTRITWVIGRLEASLIGDIENVEFIVFDKKLGRKAFQKLKTDLADREFDILLMLQAALRASLASRYIKAKIKLGFDRPRAKDFQWLFSQEKIATNPKSHVMDGLFGFTEALGIRHQVHDWQIPLSDTDYNFAKKMLANKKTVLISPCSSERANNFRNWPENKFANIIDYLVEQDFQVILTGGPTEQEKLYGKTIQQLSQSESVVNLIGKTSLKELYALIQEADLVIAPDSGPIHMANSACTPCVGLYASSNPLRTGPYHFQHLVVNKYPEAVHHFLHKSIDKVKWGRRVRNSEVMNMITTAEVIEKINIALGLSQT